MFIRDIELSSPALLAPMEGVTDLAFRRLIRAVGGCGLTVTEFIPAKSLKEKHRRALRMARFDPDEHPISIQLFGRDPHQLADAARFVVELGADIVDLNMGCPSKRVCRNSGGSSLMREPQLAKEIVQAIRGAVTVPFTVKMRAGWDDALRNAPEIAKMCEGEGADMLVVHWRTRADAYGGVQSWSTVREVKESVAIPVCANGDIVDISTYERAIAETGCDAVMIGRGALKDPWVFKKIAAHHRGEPEVIVDMAERKRVLLAYYQLLVDDMGDSKGCLGRVKQMARYFTENVEDGHELRNRLYRCSSVPEAVAIVNWFFDEWLVNNAPSQV